MALSSVKVPAELTDLFERAEEAVQRYFGALTQDPSEGSLDVGGQRYLLVRASSMSVEFFDTVQRLYASEGEEEARRVARDMLFDVAHAMGFADAQSFANRMGLEDPIAKLSAGPVHFAHAGWAFVHIFERSRPTPDDEYQLVYDHPFSFEADAWLRADRTSEDPVCVMNAGYSSGWCEASYGVSLVATEILCRAKGDAHCRFVMAPPGRVRQRIAEYLADEPTLRPHVTRYEVPGFFRRRQEAAQERARLDESEELNQRLVEALPGGVVHVRANGSIVSGNAEALRVLGLSFDALTQKYTQDFDTVTLHEDGSPAHAEHYPVTRAILTGEAQPPETLGVRRADGTVSWAVYRAVPVKDARGTTTGAIATFLDITERKQAEEERQRIESRITEAQKLESLGVLAGGIAHEFNNLLVGVLGNASLARDRLGLGRDVSRLLEEIENAAADAAKLTKRMLAFSGKGSFQVSVLDLGRVVHQARDVLGAAVAAACTLEVEPPDSQLPIEADESQLEQILLNLVANASEAYNDTPGVITLRTGRVTPTPESLGAELSAFSLGEGELCFVECIDNGAGMSPETRARLFDPFFTTKFSGRGLGMAAVLGVVRGHRGAITVESREGQGTSVRVMFPRSNREVVVRADASLAAPKRAARCGTVLVIDDERSVRLVAEHVLRDLGFTVLTAEDGIAGLDLFLAHREAIEVILLDLTMPRMGGGETLERIRQIDATIPVVLLSGFSEEEATRQFGSQRLSGFLEKPFSTKQLAAQVLSAADR